MDDLTPQNIVSPLPDIGAAVQPVPLSEPNLWCDLNALIAQNPIMSLVVLFGATALLWRKK